MNKMKEYDIVVVGGGASGLAAAIEAKRASPALSAAVIERLPRVGKKLLATGNGRCNFTNREISENHYRGSCTRFFPVVEGFDAEAFLRGAGVFGAADGEGRVYPVSGCASAVLDGLRLEAARLGTEEICGAAVSEIRAGKRFTLFLGQEAVRARSVILAGGGLSQSSLGSDGSALRLARSLGLKVRPLFPALVPLKTETLGLKGVRTRARAELHKNGKIFKIETGEVQFGESTLSGICVFNLSLWYDEGENADIVLDLLPDMSGAEVFGALCSLRELRGGALPEDMLTGLLHKRLGQRMLKSFTSRSAARAGDLTDGELRRLADGIKRAAFPVKGTAGFEKSQVTRGGVDADELLDTLESRKIPGLFVCGEMLDIAGECGGYNLAFAFASGALAGKSCAVGCALPERGKI